MATANRFWHLAVTILTASWVGLACTTTAAAEEPAGLKAGQKAPEFRAAASDGKTYALADLKGKVVVLYFYPKDDTPGCTVEAKGFQSGAGDFAAAGAVVLGVSRDDLASHNAFAGKYGLTFPLLVDADGALHDAYGAWKEGSMFGRTALGVDRSTVVIDREGIVRKVWRGVSPEGHADEVLAFVKSLKTP